MRSCDRVIKIAASGETLSGHDFFMNPGGKGANQAVARSKMGAKTYMIGAVGCDVFGQAYYKSSEKYGCSAQFVKKMAS